MCSECICKQFINDISFRISGHSRSPSPSTSASSNRPPPLSANDIQKHNGVAKEKPTAAEAVTKQEPEMELDLVTTPPPVEVSLAARRAKRQAILAKLGGIASSSISPSPMLRAGSTDSGVGQSSANMLLPSISTSSTDPISQTHSVALTPRDGCADENGGPVPESE